MRGRSEATRELARRAGRDSNDIRFFLYAKVITADTETAVQRKYEEYLSSVNYDGAMALLCGWSGIDFSKFDPDKPLRYIETNAARTVMQAFIPERRGPASLQLSGACASWSG